METYDIIMLVVLLAATLFGAIKGLAWQIASLGSIVVSYFVAYRYYVEFSGYIKATDPWNKFLAMFILYAVTSIAIWFAFRLVAELIDKVKLKEFDRQFGAILGFAKGAILCAIITLFAVTLLGPRHKQTIFKSRSGHYIGLLLDKSAPIMPDEVRTVLKPYINKLDEGLENPDFQGDDEGADGTQGDFMDGIAEDMIDHATDEFSERVERSADATKDRIRSELERR